MTEQKKQSLQEDKSINDLLKEYADDVKDKDLDDFLKNENDDAFEAGDIEGDDTDSQGVHAPLPEKKSSVLGVVFLFILFGAAGAGTYVYMKRDEGLTQIMGRFKAEDQQAAYNPVPEQTPVVPEVANVPAQPAADVLPTQPMTIENETSVINNVEVESLPAMEQPVAVDTQGLSATVQGVQPAAQINVAAGVPSTPDTAQAADTWAAQSTQTSDAPVSADPVKAETQAQKPVADVKAQTQAADVAKVEVAKEEAAPEVAAAAVVPQAQAEKEASVAPVVKAKAPLSPLDEALPPPYKAIQAQKGVAAVSGANPQTQTLPGAVRMAPVVDESAKMAASVVPASARNLNEADITSATGDYRSMVMAQGGKIEIEGSKTSFVAANQSAPAPQQVLQAPAPVAPAPVFVPEVVAVAPVQAQAAEASSNYPVMPQLAITGGKSLPDTADDDIAAPSAVNNIAVVPSAPVVQAPAVVAPVVPQVPVAAPVVVPQATATSSNNDAKSVLNQAVALEKAGNAAAALPLYQKALELDAVYADGKSIDRNFVYDRIGVIRAGAR